MPQFGIHAVTVPGTVTAGRRSGRARHADAWQVLQPAIELATEGFPVGEVTARAWHAVGPRIKDSPDALQVYWPNGRALRPARSSATRGWHARCA